MYGGAPPIVPPFMLRFEPIPLNGIPPAHRRAACRPRLAAGRLTENRVHNLAVYVR